MYLQKIGMRLKFKSYPLHWEVVRKFDWSLGIHANIVPTNIGSPKIMFNTVHKMHSEYELLFVLIHWPNLTDTFYLLTHFPECNTTADKTTTSIFYVEEQNRAKQKFDSNWNSNEKQVKICPKSCFFLWHIFLSHQAQWAGTNVS